MKITLERRDAAIADYRRGVDSLAVVAKRHGVSTTALHSWIRPPGNRRPSDDIALHGGDWVYDRARGVMVWQVAA